MRITSADRAIALMGKLDVRRDGHEVRQRVRERYLLWVHRSDSDGIQPDHRAAEQGGRSTELEAMPAVGRNESQETRVRSGDSRGSGTTIKLRF